MQSGERYFSRYRLAFIGIVILSALVYLPSFFGQAMWDDKEILSGVGIGGGKSAWDCFTKPFLLHYYRPFTSLSYFADLHFLGPNPVLFHQTNILLHAVATALLIWLTQSVFQNHRTSLIAGLFFAIQPAQVGTVAWIGGRCDQLGAILVIAMSIGLVQFHRSGKSLWLLGSLVTFFTMMMVKEQFALFGLLVPMAAYAYRPTKERFRSAITTTIPFLLSGCGFAALWAANYPSPFTPVRLGVVEQTTRFALSTVHYTALMVVPNPWTMNSFTVESLRNPIFVLLGIALLIGGAFGIRVLWKHDRTLAWLASGTAVGFLPVSNLVPVPSFLVAPYRLGAVCPLVAMLIAVACIELFRRKLLVPAMLITAGALSGFVLTPWGSSKWTSEPTAFSTFVAYDPGALFIRSGYIGSLSSQHRNEEALVESDAMLNHLIGSERWRSYQGLSELVESDPTIRWRLWASDGNNRDPREGISIFLALHGHILRALSRDNEAIRCLQEATRLDWDVPQGWLELGQIARSRKDPKAVQYLSKAVDCNPDDYLATSILAKTCAEAGNTRRAYALLSGIGKLRPPYGEPLLDFAEMQIDRKEWKGASATLDQAATTIVDRDRLTKLRLRVQQAQSVVLK